MVDLIDDDGTVTPFVYGICAICDAGLPSRERHPRIICPDNPECRRALCVYAARRTQAVIKQRPPQTTRRCAACGETKPLDTEHFYPRNKTRGELEYWCKQCRLLKSRAAHIAQREQRNADKRAAHRRRVENETQQERAARLEKVRQASERYRHRHSERFARIEAESKQRMMRDPVRHARHLEVRRLRHRFKAASEGREVTARTVVVHVDRWRVPSAPLAWAVKEWATRKLTCSYMADGMPGVDMESLMAGLGTTGRAVRRWRSGESPTTNFDVADLVVTGMGALWFDVYDPERWAKNRVFSGSRRLDVLAWVDAVWRAQTAWEGEE